MLDEVVVVGYGTSTSSALSGSVAGVSSTSNIKIRGVGSFKTKGTPLYVIDGVISSANDFKRLDESMIASADILKD
ncbi:TonB-dependent receptor plug domain-containing protein, partial [Oceanospirillum sp. D5]|nr:TonB-dependent receptor plug domain-containing protein [Oceanospirillum sediminis]